MLDIQWIRENPEAFDLAMKNRGESTRSLELLDLDRQRRESMSEVQQLQGVGFLWRDLRAVEDEL